MGGGFGGLVKLTPPPPEKTTLKKPSFIRVNTTKLTTDLSYDDYTLFQFVFYLILSCFVYLLLAWVPTKIRLITNNEEIDRVANISIYLCRFSVFVLLVYLDVSTWLVPLETLVILHKDFVKILCKKCALRKKRCQERLKYKETMGVSIRPFVESYINISNFLQNYLTCILILGYKRLNAYKSKWLLMMM